MTCGAEPPLKRNPSGYPSTHPRSELLRWKGAAVVQKYDRADWMHTAEVIVTIRDVWCGARPLKDWLEANVGATTEPVR